MMDTPKALDRQVREVVAAKEDIRLKSENFVIRIIPLSNDVYRISMSDRDEFDLRQGEEYISQPVTDYSVSEDDDEVRITSGQSTLIVNKDTGSITAMTQDGCRYSEAKFESKKIEKYDVWKYKKGATVKVEKITTPDGIKSRVSGGEKEYEGQLYRTWLNFSLASDEVLIGLGQSEEGIMNLRHTTRYLHQANRKISVPVMISNKGYGIVMSTASPAIFRDDEYGSYIFTEADRFLDYYLVLSHDPKAVVKFVRKLSGKAVLLPKWALGYLQSQERFETAEELLTVGNKFRELEIGCDALILDWLSWPDGQWGQKSFDETRFPNVPSLMEELHSKNLHLMMSIWPNMAECTPNHQEMARENLLLTGTEIYDAFSKEGRALYQKQLVDGLASKGVDAWWCDSSEPITPEWNYMVRPDPAINYAEFVNQARDIMPIEKANAYGYYHAMCVDEAVKSEDRRVCNLTRNGYLGSQKFGTILWSGDISASWETFRRQIVEGLQFVSTGLPYWTLDIGAFFVKHGPQWFWDGDYQKGLGDPAYKELYVRWFQYGAFLPIFRAHGTDIRREPWNFGEKGDPFYDALIAAIDLRYKLMPYIYTGMYKVWHDDESFMRMLSFDFPEDTRCWQVGDQYMFGDSIMVCPVTEERVHDENDCYVMSTKTVYLPAGTSWFDFYTFEHFEGGQTITVSVPLNRIPLFVRNKSLIPIQDAVKSTAGEYQNLKFVPYSDCDCECYLYDDKGDGYGYMRGEYELTRAVYSISDDSIAFTKMEKEQV